MPANRNNLHVQDDDHQGSQDNLFIDAVADVGDQSDHDDVPPTQPDQALLDFTSLFKKKNANVKRRITIALNALTPLEKDNIPIHDDDLNSARKHIMQVDKALEILNEVIDDVPDDIDQDDIQPFSKIASDYMPQIMEIRARVNNVQTKLSPLQVGGPPVPAQNGQGLVTLHKIDHTFKPDLLDKDATPAIFQIWKEQFQVYAERNRFDKATLKEQRILLSKCLTPDMHANLKRACTSSDAKSLDDLLNEVEKYILRSNNLVMRRYQYFNCVQMPGESYEDYITRFRDIGDFADFDSFSYDDNMICRLITGIINEDLRGELLRLPKSDFQTVQDFTLAWAASKSNASKVIVDKSSGVTNRDINKVSAYKAGKRSSFQKNAGSNTSTVNRQAPGRKLDQQPGQSAPGDKHVQNLPRPCNRCGYVKHSNGRCPAVNQECSFCHKVGHFQSVCKSATNQRSSNHINQVQDEPGHEPDENVSDDASYDQGHVNVINVPVFQVDHSPNPTPRLPVEFSFRGDGYHPGQILPDTGAAVSVFPSHMLASWNWSKFVKPSTHILKSASGENISCDGTISIDVSLYGLTRTVVFYVCPDVKCVLVSWTALKDLGVVSKYFPRPAHILQVLHSNSEINMYKQSIVESFPKVFNPSNTLSPMRGDPMIIHLRSNIDWSNINVTFKPRPIPIPLRQAAKSEIDAMLAKNIIIPVEKPTQFVSPMLVVPKKGHGIRLVIDYTELNKFIRRPIHPFPSVPEVKALIPSSAKYFATFDALQGYWQVPLHSSSQELTTFLTPWGRFCFTRAPMGLASSGDEYCRRGDLAFQGIPNVIKVVDDVLVHASTMDELKTLINEVMNAAQSHGISLSPSKFSIGQSVSFVGLNISAEGIRPDPKQVQALAEFPTPKNKTDLRSFFGLLNQFATFSKDVTPISKPLRPLLSKETVWNWTPEHNQSFIMLRKLLTVSPILAYFSPDLDTKILTDASRLNGLGYVLLQRHHDKWAMVSCGSRMINSTERNYAVCELEALAIVWAIQKCRMYLMGLQTFTVVTDHRPLVTIFNSARLIRNDNPRLVRLLQKVAPYNFIVKWIPGRMHKIPDALSRSPLPLASSDSPVQVYNIVEPTVQIQDPALAKLSEEAKTCDLYLDLFNAVSTMSSFDVNKLPKQSHAHIRAFLSIWDRLSCDVPSGLVLLDASKIVVPSVSRKRILALVHASHQGITRTKARLQSMYFWHGMGNDVVQTVQNCDLCLKFRPCQPSMPLKLPDAPKYPFQKTSCDLFDFRGSFTIVYVDRFSGWPLVAHFAKSPSSAQIIKVLSVFFRDFGIPTALRHDGARPLVSQEFRSFLKQHLVRDELSAAYHPESNGHAEAAVKAVKSLVKKCWMSRQLDLFQFNIALLEWRNTPRMPGGRSPAELLFNRKLRMLLPNISYAQLSDQDVTSAVNKNYNALKVAYKTINSRKRAFKPLTVGDVVLMRNTASSTWDKKGTIDSIRPHGSSYLVSSQGKLFLRNRKHLKKLFSVKSSQGIT